jgi:beta-lactamase class D
VTFLRRFYREDLPIRPEHLKKVREGLEQQPGTVQNALGVHRIPGDWRKATLSAKTGATTTVDHRVSWLVGLLRSSGRDYVFAAAVWRADTAVDTLDAARLAVNTFIRAKLLPGAVRPG